MAGESHDISEDVTVTAAARQGETAPRFDLRPVIEQVPLIYTSAKAFLGLWFRNNDFISPDFTNRQHWERETATEDILRERPEGGKTLLLPYNLRLEEMVGVLEKIDQDTFAGKNERGSEASENVRELMSFLRDTGVYFYTHLDSIQSINQDFYTSQIKDTD